MNVNPFSLRHTPMAQNSLRIPLLINITFVDLIGYLNPKLRISIDEELFFVFLFVFVVNFELWLLYSGWKETKKKYEKQRFSFLLKTTRAYD